MKWTFPTPLNVPSIGRTTDQAVQLKILHGSAILAVSNSERNSIRSSGEIY